MEALNLPEKIGEYQLQTISWEDLTIVEYSTYSHFKNLLCGINDDNGLLYQVRARTRDEAMELMSLKLDLIRFCRNDFGNNKDIKLEGNSYIQVNSPEQNRTQKIQNFFYIYSFSAESNCTSLAIVSVNIAEDIFPIIEFVKKVQNENGDAFSLRIQGEVRDSNGVASKVDTKDSVFNNTIHLYTDNLSKDIQENLIAALKSNGFVLKIIDSEYREKIKPKFFICHDSRDKEHIAKPLYRELTKQGVKTWYDEFSLRIGDSLTESIQNGIKECQYAIIIISKNFLMNERWIKYELQSIITKQISSKGKTIILPIWHDITENDLVDYSYYLLDKVAGKTSEGFDKLVFKLKKL